MSTGMDGQASNDQTLVIGIDFGTTFSSVAYGISRHSEGTQICSSWPTSNKNEEITNSAIVPTIIRYPSQSGEVEWGFQIPEATVHPDEIMRWFKLNSGLQNAQNRPEVIQNMLVRHDTDRLVTDYLSGLGQSFLDWARKRIGSVVVDDFVKRRAVQFVLTVPAVWEDLAKSKTLQAFEHARQISELGKYTLVSEPEAAATYALHTMSQGSSLEVGQSFIVLDAGGDSPGTVDTITYTITNLHPVLQVRETAAGAGDFCGAVFIDKAFTDHIQVTLGKEEGFDNEVLGRARKEFETVIKPAFTQAMMPNGRFTVPVLGMANNPEIGIRNGRLTLRAFEVHAMFEPCILKTIRLVKDQIATAKVPIAAVILVGGFGTSEYLRERLKQEVEEKMHVPIRTSKDPSLAVVHGAVMRGMAQVAPERHTVLKVVDRAARRYTPTPTPPFYSLRSLFCANIKVVSYTVFAQAVVVYSWTRTPWDLLADIEYLEHYGTELSVVYDQGKHRELEDKRSWDGLDGCWRVDAMRWFIRHGDRVAEDKPYTHFFSQTSRVSFGRPRTILLTIYSDSKSNEAPVARNNNVDDLCHVEADLSRIPTERLHVRRGRDGFDYYELRCEIEIICKYPASTVN
ncbi:actin-like ATPase domain-containing protein [Apiospora arundinis]|uniref:Actin-like ATPase domain-containing protein n=1 Tax=Apiospora arundinis TaxID=335852 RepID=A0ABR2I0V6_9PEZI